MPVFHVYGARLSVEMREGALEGTAVVADLLRMRADEHVGLGVAHRIGEPRQLLHHLRRFGVGPAHRAISKLNVICRDLGYHELLHVPLI